MKRTLILMLLIFFFGCSKEDRYGNSCNPENPLEMDWMSEWIGKLQNCACTISIFQAEYEGNPVFWQLMTDPLCSGVIENITVHCCIGCELLVLEDYDDLVEFQNKVTDLKIIYNCPTPQD